MKLLGIFCFALFLLVVKISSFSSPHYQEIIIYYSCYLPLFYYLHFVLFGSLSHLSASLPISVIYIYICFSNCYFIHISLIFCFLFSLSYSLLFSTFYVSFFNLFFFALSIIFFYFLFFIFFLFLFFFFICCISFSLPFLVLFVIFF